MDKVGRPPGDGDPRYYSAYEDRYKMVYSQGVAYWSAFPQEAKADLEGLDVLFGLFRDNAARGGMPPGPDIGTSVRARVLEAGCGEAPLATEVLSRGFNYVGVDLAASALAKARVRVRAETASGKIRPGQAQLLRGDVTDLSFLDPGSFDLAVDIGLLHMLVVDKDREDYLRGLSRALKPGAPVLLRELIHAGAYEGPIESFEHYMSLFAPDLDTLEERTAFNDGQARPVLLPRLPARPRSEEGYRRELGRFGFQVIRFDLLDFASECRMIARYAPAVVASPADAGRET